MEQVTKMYSLTVNLIQGRYTLQQSDGRAWVRYPQIDSVLPSNEISRFRVKNAFNKVPNISCSLKKIVKIEGIVIPWGKSRKSTIQVPIWSEDLSRTSENPPKNPKICRLIGREPAKHFRGSHWGRSRIPWVVTQLQNRQRRKIWRGTNRDWMHHFQKKTKHFETGWFWSGVLADLEPRSKSASEYGPPSKLDNLVTFVFGSEIPHSKIHLLSARKIDLPLSFPAGRLKQFHWTQKIRRVLTSQVF